MTDSKAGDNLNSSRRPLPLPLHPELSEPGVDGGAGQLRCPTAMKGVWKAAGFPAHQICWPPSRHPSPDSFAIPRRTGRLTHVHPLQLATASRPNATQPGYNHLPIYPHQRSRLHQSTTTDDPNPSQILDGAVTVVRPRGSGRISERAVSATHAARNTIYGAETSDDRLAVSGDATQLPQGSNRRTSRASVAGSCRSRAGAAPMRLPMGQARSQGLPHIASHVTNTRLCGTTQQGHERRINNALIQSEDYVINDSSLPRVSRRRVETSNVARCCPHGICTVGPLRAPSRTTSSSLPLCAPISIGSTFDRLSDGPVSIASSPDGTPIRSPAKPLLTVKSHS